jgi:hypothetical protein
VGVGRQEGFLHTVADDEFSAHVLVIAEESNLSPCCIVWVGFTVRAHDNGFGYRCVDMVVVR